MLTNQTHSKRLPKPSFKKPKPSSVKASYLHSQESEEITAERKIDAEYTEYMRGMKLTRYVAISEMITIALMPLGLLAIYKRHGYIPDYMLSFSGIMFMIMIPMAISLWRQSRDFFLEHNKK